MISFFDKCLNLPYLTSQTPFLRFINTYCNDTLPKNHNFQNWRKRENNSLNNLIRNAKKVKKIEKKIAGNNEKRSCCITKRGQSWKRVKREHLVSFKGFLYIFVAKYVAFCYFLLSVVFCYFLVNYFILLFFIFLFFVCRICLCYKFPWLLYYKKKKEKYYKKKKIFLKIFWKQGIFTGALIKNEFRNFLDGWDTTNPISYDIIN